MLANIVLITADDMNYDSPGAAGCIAPGITPNIDRLAAEGVRFVHSHVTSSVCQPSRQSLMTGLYPHRNGGLGFDPIREEVPTLQEQLHRAGYINGILGKVRHLEPRHKFHWSMEHDMMDLGYGRDPLEFYRYTRQFLDLARKKDRPFFLMVNSHDPHRPFAGSADEQSETYSWEKEFKPEWRKEYGPPPRASRYYQPEEVEVPGFLPDLPDVRREIAQYFSSVHRCDETVGKVLLALRECGFEDDTLVMFLSDNGMAFPFAKANCYLTSSRTPWIVRWPGRIEAGKVDNDHLITGVDYLPTILEAAGLDPLPGIDGRSFYHVLMGEKAPRWDEVLTFFDITYKRDEYPMRGVQNRKFGYIYNRWSDGRTVFRNEAQSGLTFKAMRRAAGGDPAIADRLRLFEYRVPEEFYDYENDPCALRNLIHHPDYRQEINRLRGALLESMLATADPQLEAFQRLLERK
jgi:N-sulfoglucosamine sulfohydrolase